jgi:hypothetical protein
MHIHAYGSEKTNRIALPSMEIGGLVSAKERRMQYAHLCGWHINNIYMQLDLSCHDDVTGTELQYSSPHSFLRTTGGSNLHIVKPVAFTVHG